MKRGDMLLEGKILQTEMNLEPGPETPTQADPEIDPVS